MSGGAPGATRYRPRTEGLFARIEHHPDADPAKDHWEVRSKDGLVSTYGGVDADGELAEVADSDPVQGARRVFAWKLTRTVDPFGNRIEYLYERDDIRQEDSPSYHRWGQLYPTEIWYVDYGDDPDTSQFLVKVRFDYEQRPDPFSDYRAGFEIRTVRRCTAIRVCTYPDGVETPVRTYKLTYLAPPPRNGASLLHEVKVVGHDGTATEALPPLEFGYTPFAPETKRDFFPLTGPDLPPGSLAHPDYELADLFGTGLPDILEMNGTVRYWRNLGNGTFDRPRQMQEAPAWQDRHVDPGPYRPGVFGWVLASPHRFTIPIPGRGALGLFFPPTEIQERLRKHERSARLLRSPLPRVEAMDTSAHPHAQDRLHRPGDAGVRRRAVNNHK